ncbi:MAG: hypothetical protein ACI9LM_005664 [Alteromonadaceae bacterium]|jgi:hypothetical protein
MSYTFQILNNANQQIIEVNGSKENSRKFR